MTQLPEPLTPPDCDLTGMNWMPFHGHRLKNSDFYLRASDREKIVAQELWWAAWFQVPAASLPDDDLVIAALAGYARDIKGWAKIRKTVLHGFVKCSDGRLYHRFLAKEAITSFELRLKSNSKRQADRERLQRWRDNHKRKGEGSGGGNAARNASETQNGTANETRFVGGRPDQTLPKKDSDSKESLPPAVAVVDLPPPINEPVMEPAEVLFGHCMRYLQAATGRRGQGLRSLLGRWRKTLRDDVPRLIELIKQAEGEGLSEPIAWIEMAVDRIGGPNRSMEAREARARARVAEIARLDAEVAGRPAEHVFLGNTIEGELVDG